jgi:peptidoglycan/LPS O-acetylase OafA/YrhL
VLGYHFFPDTLAGGFIGVDVFFTFSGYLVTALAIRQFMKHGAFDVLDFYNKRVKRIVPPLLLAVLFTLPFALLLDAEFLVQLGRRISATFAFIRNYYEIVKGGSYEENLFPKLYVHTWSLSVEMQLYIVWGAVLALLSKYTKRKNKKSAALRRYVSISAIIFAAVSYMQMQSMFTPAADPAAAYYATHSHSFPFFIGAAAACLLGVRSGKRFKRFAATAGKPLGILGAAASVGALIYLSRILAYSDEATYRWGFLAATGLACVLILSARTLHDAFPKSGEPKFLTAVSDLSYYIYLFHWPIYIIVNNTLAGSLGFMQAIPGELARTYIAVFVIALTLLISALCQYVLEPFISGRKTILRGMGSALAGSLLAVSVLLCVLAVGASPTVSPMSLRFANEYLLGDLRALAQRAEQLTIAAANAEKPIALPSATPKPTQTIAPTETPVPLATPAAVIELPQSVPTTVPEPTPQPSHTPAPSPTQAPIGRVSLIGDSVSLGAKSALEKGVANCKVDAEVSRNIIQGPDMMVKYIRNGNLGDCVVIALGTNGNRYYESYITEIIELLPVGHRMIFVTPYDGRWTSSWASYKTTQYLRSIDGKYDYITIADWADFIDDHINWLTSDKVHLKNDSAVNAYVNVVNEAIEVAKLKPVKSGGAGVLTEPEQKSDAARVMGNEENGFPSDVIVSSKKRGKIETNGNPLNIRQGASADSAYLGQVSYGESIEYYETTKSAVWVYIVYGDLRGYGSARYIR